MDPNDDDAFSDDGNRMPRHRQKEPRAVEEDYYALLNVPEDATEEQIHTSYKHLAILLHPDKHPPENREAAAARFKALNGAYQVLSDPEKRALYDALGVLGMQSELAQDERFSSVEELRAKFHRLLRAHNMEERERLEATSSIRGAVICGVDATRLFRPRSAAVQLSGDLARITYGEDDAEDEDDADGDDSSDGGGQGTLFSDDQPTNEEASDEKNDSADAPTEEETLDIDLAEEEEPPTVHVSRLNVSQACHINVNPSVKLSLAGSAFGSPSRRGIGNMMGTVRWMFSDNVLVMFGCNFVGRGAPFVEIVQEASYLPGCALSVHASFPTLMMPPPITVSVTGRVAPGLLAQIIWSSGTWTLPFWPPIQWGQLLPVVDLTNDLVDELKRRGKIDAATVESTGWAEDDITPAERKTRILAALYRAKTPIVALAAGLTKFQYPFICANIQSTPTPEDPSKLTKSLAIVMNSRRNGSISASVGGAILIDALLRRLVGSKLIKEQVEQQAEEAEEEPHSLSWVLRSTVGLIDPPSITAGLDGKAGLLRWGVGLTLSGFGITLRVRVARLGQRLVLPILLAKDLDAALAVGTVSVVGSIIFGCVCAGEVIRLRQGSLRLKALREARAEARARKRREAEKVRDMLRDQVRRSVAAEEASHGLLIHEATYGPEAVLAGTRAPTDEETFDVRISLQALIRSGRLHIPGGRGKSGLLGFYDVCPGEKKALRVVYEFGGQRYQVVVGDKEELTAPSDAHAIHAESAESMN